MELLEALNARYSTKEFDTSKKISDDNLKIIEQLLQLAPSSTNIQPWHFIVATTDDGKKRIAKGTEGFYSFNEHKVLDAPAVIVFSTRNDINHEFLAHLLEKEDQDGRFPKNIGKDETDAARRLFVDIHKFDYKDLQHWAEKQVYLNFGSFLLGVAELGMDAIPMEGLNMKVLDEEFGLRDKGFTSTLVVAVGYRKDSDFNSSLPKSRLAIEDIIEHI